MFVIEQDFNDFIDRFEPSISHGQSSEALSGTFQMTYTSIVLRDSSIREQGAPTSIDDSPLMHSGYSSLQGSSRSRDYNSIYGNNAGSNRFLSGGLDQRIIKQSSEDCRRLLQQVRFKTDERINVQVFSSYNPL